MSLQDDVKNKMKSGIEHFKSELKNLRTNRANPAILDNVYAEVYGSEMKIKELASVTAPESRQLLITPYDASTVHAIGKGIERANLNLMPIVDGNVIRINIPPMDESMRKEIAKLAKKKAEEAKVSIREIRRKCNEQARKMKADGDMTEDELKKAEKFIQENTDQSCKLIDDLAADKEKEILTI